MSNKKPCFFLPVESIGMTTVLKKVCHNKRSPTGDFGRSVKKIDGQRTHVEWRIRSTDIVWQFWEFENKKHAFKFQAKSVNCLKIEEIDLYQYVSDSLKDDYNVFIESEWNKNRSFDSLAVSVYEKRLRVVNQVGPSFESWRPKHDKFYWWSCTKSSFQ